MCIYVAKDLKVAKKKKEAMENLSLQEGRTERCGIDSFFFFLLESKKDLFLGKSISRFLDHRPLWASLLIEACPTWKKVGCRAPNTVSNRPGCTQTQRATFALSSSKNTCCELSSLKRVKNWFDSSWFFGREERCFLFSLWLGRKPCVLRPSQEEVAHDGIRTYVQQAINNIITLDIKKAVSSTLSIEWERGTDRGGISFHTRIPLRSTFNRKLCHRM